DVYIKIEGIHFTVGFHMFFKVVHNGLPSLLLHVQGIGALGIKSLCYSGGVPVRGKGYFYRPAIAHGIYDPLMRLYFLILSAKIKTETAVLSFHSGREFPSYPKIVFCPG